jgi:hypothetical protein
LDERRESDIRMGLSDILSRNPNLSQIIYPSNRSTAVTIQQRFIKMAKSPFCSG